MNKKALEIACKEYNSDTDHNGNYGHFLADAILRQKENEELEKRAELEINLEFLKKSERLNIDNVYSDREVKQELIRKYFNYTKLNGSGKKELLKDCSDHKIGSAFRSIYYSALKKMKKYGEGRD